MHWLRATGACSDSINDFRDRHIETDGEIDFFEKLTLDNLNRVTRVDRYDTSTSPVGQAPACLPGMLA